jgi:hypothetical protein
MDSVKIDSELLKEIEDFLSKKENKIKYVSKKHFVDVAVLSLLENEKVKDVKEFKAKSTKMKIKEAR